MNWTSYLQQPPPCGVLVEFKQLDGDPAMLWTGYKSDLHPTMSAASLYWRLTGIGKMQLEG